MTTINIGTIIRNSNPASGQHGFFEKSTISAAVSPTVFPASVSTTNGVAISTDTLSLVEIFADAVSANAYQQANPTANVGYPVDH